MKYIKIILKPAFILLIISIYILISILHIKAQDFSFDYEVKNIITTDYKLISDYTITVTHLSGDGFISTTQITYPLKPDNVIAKKGLDTLTTRTEQDSNGNYIIFINQKPLLGKGTKFTYNLQITTSAAIEKKGDILDVFVPEVQVNESISVSRNILSIAKSLPSLNYISKKYQVNTDTQKLDTQEKDYNHYIIDDSASISLILGQKSKYSYTLTIIPKDNAVFVPSDFQNQKIIVSNLDTSPTDTLIDADNSNVALSFSSSDNPVIIKGEVEIETDRYKAGQPNGQVNLDNTFWKYDTRLSHLLDAAKSQYDISTRVHNTINQLSQIVKFDSSDLKVERLSIKDLLDKSVSAHSLNISDIMVTVLREAGINTRLVGGFVDAQLQNKFENNGLHFWIEYYDPSFGGWKSADPTLQLVSPNDNYYDGVGLSHIAVFKTSNGFNVPHASTYLWQASIESGEVKQNESLSSQILTDKIISGKDKFINIEIKNNGNTISHVTNINTSLDNINNTITTTNIDKVLFPNQSINVNSKIKNDNFYDDKIANISALISTDHLSINSQKNIKLEKSSPQIIIAIAVGLAIVLIVASIFILGRRKNKSYH